MTRYAFALALLAALGCAASTTTVVSLQDIDCVSCGAKIVEELQKTPGVAAARFDRRSAEVTITHDPAKVGADALLTQVQDWGWPAVLGSGLGRYLASPEIPAGADVLWLTRTGDRVDLAAAAVPAKVTVVDFGAKWCRPCRGADEHLLARVTATPWLAIRKIDVVDWDTPVAQQHLQGVKELPYFVIFDRQGHERARVSGFDAEALDAAIDGAAQ